MKRWMLLVVMPMEDGKPGWTSVGPFDDEMDAHLFDLQHLVPSNRPVLETRVIPLLDPKEL